MTDLQLETLEARGLIRVASLEPELEYLFRHALLQDTAYESLLKQERRALHHVVGITLEELYPERVGELAAVLALHFEQSGDSEKAVHYLYEAANFALERNAILEAYDLYSRAAALLPERAADEPDELRTMRIKIQLGRVRAGFTFIPEDEGLAMIEPLIPDARMLGDLRLEADLHLTISLMEQFRGVSPEENERLRASLQRVSEIGAELGDPLIAAIPESIIGLFRVFTGDIREGVALLEKTAPQLERKHDFVGSSFALMALGLGYARLGEFDKAEDTLTRARALAEKGDIIAKLDTLIGTSWIRSAKGDLDSAVPIAMQCTDMAEAAGASACIVASNYVLGDAYLRQGKFGEAKIALDRSIDVANTLEQRQFRPTIAALVRLNAAHLGQLGAGTMTFDEAIEEARSFGDKWAEATVYWKRAEIESGKPPGEQNRDEMLADFERADSQFEEMGGRPYRARVLRDWGNALKTIGRHDEGDEKLRQAIALFDAMGIKREANDARAELERVGSV
jgi:tetratricopeptide (TPR) repeat protein